MHKWGRACPHPHLHHCARCVHHTDHTVSLTRVYRVPAESTNRAITAATKRENEEDAGSADPSLSVRNVAFKNRTRTYGYMLVRYLSKNNKGALTRYILKLQIYANISETPLIYV